MDRAATLPLTFALHVESCPAIEDALGGAYRVELHEISYGEVRRALQSASAVEHAGEALLAASLTVDGRPIGLEALDALPGRLSTTIHEVIARCMQIHGLTRAASPAPPPEEAPPDDEAPPDEAPAEGRGSPDEETPPPGEA